MVKCAWVTLVMIGDAYVPGALVLARSLQGTAHDIVCMVTNDVSAEACEQMRMVFDRVIEVPYLSHPAKKFVTQKQIELYGTWQDRSFTKWNCLGMTEYDRVMFVDADIVSLVNSDHLFELNAPAACYSSPWAYPWVENNRTPNPYVECRGKPCDLTHGDVISCANITSALHNKGYVGIGALVLLIPTIEDFEAYKKYIVERPVFGDDYNTTSTPDEVSICMYYARQNITWTHIHQRYEAIPWKVNWVKDDLRMIHYFGYKPWDIDVEEYPDLIIWWEFADKLIAEFPQLKHQFYHRIEDLSPIDIELSQLKLANRIRTLLVKHAARGKSEALTAANKYVKRWIVNFAQGMPVFSPDVNADVFSAITTKDTILEIVKMVNRRCSRTPRANKGEITFDNGAVNYGGHFSAVLTPRVATLMAKSTQEHTAQTLVRYSVLGEIDYFGLPHKYIQMLIDCKYAYEAFVSPFDASLLLPFYSLYKDTDEIYGGLGNFLTVPLRGRIVMKVPPYMLSQVEAKIISEMIDSPPTTILLMSVCEPKLKTFKYTTNFAVAESYRLENYATGAITTIRSKLYYCLISNEKDDALIQM